MKPRLRFAPSPSGYLHIGGVRTALFNWLWARKTGGKFVLRVEDTDQERSSLDSVRAILDAMTWLGLNWDEGPEVGGPFSSYFQSERKALYRSATEKLIGEGKAYRCFCTKEELDAQREALKANSPKAAFAYPGTCRERTDHPDRPYVVRFKSPREGVTEWNDKVFGVISTPNDSQQDFVLVRTDGYPLYNLAAVVDDHAMEMTLVARARDHIGNTPQQLLLYRAFGWEPPEFAHLPMMLSAKGEKLSKRHAAVSVQEYKDKGYTPAAVLNYLVRFGWSFGDQEIFSRQQLIEAFDWDRVGKGDGKFDEKKFADVAFEHLKRPELTSLDEYATWARPFLAARGLSELNDARLRQAIPTIRERARTLADAAHHLDFYFREPPEPDEKAVAKFLTAESKPRLLGLASLFEAQPSFAPAALESAFQAWIAQQGLELKDVAQPLRVALTGRSASPPLFDVLHVLGRELSLARLRRAAG
ncbi:MAG TPA: glutamate--tRNA ligase [Polyangiaceae bacterium]|nr:glutamate--tRNA ligase [Polyangiaceae bacterium]